MTIEAGLLVYLATQAGLVAKVSSRIYAMHAPQNVTLPCITYQRISTARNLTHDLTSSTLSDARFQFDIFAQKYIDALAISEELRKALQGYAGAMSTETVYAVLPVLEQHLDDPDMDYFRLTIDYIISHKE